MQKVDDARIELFVGDGSEPRVIVTCAGAGLFPTHTGLSPKNRCGWVAFRCQLEQGITDSDIGSDCTSSEFARKMRIEKRRWYALLNGECDLVDRDTASGHLSDERALFVCCLEVIHVIFVGVLARSYLCSVVYCDCAAFSNRRKAY